MRPSLFLYTFILKYTYTCLLFLSISKVQRSSSYYLIDYPWQFFSQGFHISCSIGALTLYSECRLSCFLNKFFIFGAYLFWYNTCPLSSLSSSFVIMVDPFFVILLSYSFSFVLSFKGQSLLYSAYVARHNACLVLYEHSTLAGYSSLYIYIYLMCLFSFWVSSPMSTATEYN